MKIESHFPDLAFGFDGRMYVNIAGFDNPARLSKRRKFIGWELRSSEFSLETAQGKTLAELAGVVCATDGKFYGNADWVPVNLRQSRGCFRGAALHRGERTAAVERINRLAHDVSMRVQRIMKPGKAASQRARSARDGT